MMQYDKFLSELSAMDNTVKQHLAYLRSSSSSKSDKLKAAKVTMKQSQPAQASESMEDPMSSIFPSLDYAMNRFHDIGAISQDSLPLFEPAAGRIFDDDLKKPATSVQVPSAKPSSAPTCSPSTFLHRACQLFPKCKDVIEIALSTEPGAASASAQIEAASNTSEKSHKKTQLRERYTYPLNIALFHKASPSVVDLLGNADPDILVTPDGRDGHTSLGILLQLRSRADSCLPLVDTLLQANPVCAHTVVDRRQNYAIHVACSKGAPLEVIKRLHQAFPAAISKRNLSGETPLMIAQRYCACREDVLDFLQTKTWR